MFNSRVNKSGKNKIMVGNREISIAKPKNQWMGILWILPALAFVVFFRYFPAISAFFYSLTDWRGNPNFTFVGFQNYIELFKTELFYNAFLQMIAFTLSCMTVGFIARIILSEVLFNMKSAKMASFWKFMFVLPAMIPGTVTVFIWGKFILDGTKIGLLNSIIVALGGEHIQWFSDERYVFLAILIYQFPFVTGTSILIYLAGLYNISDSVIEAAQLDGISIMRRIFSIDLPLISGQIKYFIVIGIIDGIQSYTLQYSIILPTEDYMSSAMVPGWYMYQQAFDYSRYGYACAVGIVLFVIILIVTIINNKFIKSDVS